MAQECPALPQLGPIKRSVSDIHHCRRRRNASMTYASLSAQKLEQHINERRGLARLKPRTREDSSDLNTSSSLVFFTRHTMTAFSDDHKVVANNSPTYGEDLADGIDSAAAIPKGTLDPVYEAKARVLNKAIQDIGMGWVRCSSQEDMISLSSNVQQYQWQLFIVVGFGWANGQCL
jgi:hypothetical protein